MSARVRASFVGAVAALSTACTLLWPIEDYELRSANDDGGANAEDGGLDASTGEDALGNVIDAPPDVAPPSNVEVFAAVGGVPRIVALNSTHSFVIGQDEKVIRIDKAARFVETLATPALGYAGQPYSMTDVAADSQWIFLAGTEQAGCGAPARAWRRAVVDSGVWNGIAEDCASYRALALDAIDLALALEYSGKTTMVLYPVVGGSPRIAARELPQASALAARPDEVYLASGPAKKIVRLAKAADAGVDLATTDGSPKDITADTDNVYWIEVEGRVATKPRKAAAGDALQTLATEPVGLYSLAQDATRLYFTNIVEGTVRTVLKSGGAVDTIASKQGEPADIAVDDSGVYWVNRADGNLMRAKK